MKKIIFLALLLVSCEAINKKIGMSDDNPVEEVIEEVIDQETGLDIDLTPTSKEK